MPDIPSRRMDFIEQATPRGITLKVFPKKWNYLAFDQKGKSIYADSSGLKVLHRVQLVAFMGENFIIKNTSGAEMSFLKATRGQIVIPYVDTIADSRQRYIFIPAESGIDLIPVRLKGLKDISMLVREIETGTRPDHIVVSGSVTRNDIIIIKNRLAGAHIILVGGKRGEGVETGDESEINSFKDQRATEVVKDVNINMMSNNPVFLARVHLREMDISKVNQLILDFDLSPIEAEYILSFVTTMLSKRDTEEDIRKNASKLEGIHGSLQFYLHLLGKNEAEVRAMIDAMNDAGLLASFFTLIAKVKLLYPGTDDQLLFTEFENLLYEKKSSLQEKN